MTKADIDTIVQTLERHLKPVIREQAAEAALDEVNRLLTRDLEADARRAVHKAVQAALGGVVVRINVEGGKCCPATRPVDGRPPLCCTLAAGHVGPHVATDTDGRYLAQWTDKP